MTGPDLGSISAVQSFIRGGRFSYATDPIQSTTAATRQPWLAWIAQPRVDKSVDQIIFDEAVESLGLSLALDRRSTADALRWLRDDRSNSRLSLRVSGASLTDPALASEMLARIDEYRIEPDRLCFDIAVHAALSDLTGATRFVKALRRAGSLIALSNGIPGNPVLGLYGPLGFVNYLKVDRRWIRSAPDSTSHRQTLESIVDYAKRLGLQVIGEGVDTNRHLELVTRLGVDFYAGKINGGASLVAESSSDGEPLVRIERSA
ncbi:MAG: EAL domain-containing protein [Pseudomonadota bacterium]